MKDKILALLKKAEEDDTPVHRLADGIRAILDPLSDAETLAGLIHATLCRRHHGSSACGYYEEVAEGNSWEKVEHKRYLNFALSLLSYTKDQKLAAAVLTKVESILSLESGLDIIAKIVDFTKEIENESIYDSVPEPAPVLAFNDCSSPDSRHS